MKPARFLSAPRTVAFLATLPFALIACGDDPLDVQFEVIETADFADSLGIDLATMEMMPNGAYRQDLTPGTGDELGSAGQIAYVDHTGFLIDGLVFSGGDRFDEFRKFAFEVGGRDVLEAFEAGLLGMLEGGTRRLILPPELGYGASPPRGSAIPPGAILLFDVTLDSIS